MSGSLNSNTLSGKQGSRSLQTFQCCIAHDIVGGRFPRYQKLINYIDLKDVVTLSYRISTEKIRTIPLGKRHLHHPGILDNCLICPKNFTKRKPFFQNPLFTTSWSRNICGTSSYIFNNIQTYIELGIFSIFTRNIVLC